MKVLKEVEHIAYENVEQQRFLKDSYITHKRLLQNSKQYFDPRNYMCHLQYVKYLQYVRIQSFSGPYFPAFGLNTERYSVSLRIQSECGKIRTRKTLNTETFHAVLLLFFM